MAAGDENTGFPLPAISKGWNPPPLRVPYIAPTQAADPPQVQFEPTELRAPQLLPPEWRAHLLIAAQDSWASSLSPNPPPPPTPPITPPTQPAVLALQLLNGGGTQVPGATTFLSVLLTDIGNVFVTDVPGEGGPLPIVGPPGSVNITLIAPSKTVVVNGAAMVPDVSVPGKYDYGYQSVTSDETGLWLVSFTAANGFGSVGRFPRRPAFRLMPPSLTH